MDGSKRPISVTVLACIYILMGAVGFAYHFQELLASGSRRDALWIEPIRLIAILCGAFMLRGQNWARWVAVAWIALHVIVSAFHSLGEFAVHLVFCAVIAWILFRPDATRYFRGARSK